MQGLAEQQLLLTLLGLAVILVFARGAGEVARRIGQPEVLGEFFAGFLLGPSVLGLVLPGLYQGLFQSPAAGLVFSGFSWIGAILLLLIAGIEVDLEILRKEARPGVLAAAFAIVPSLAVGTLFALVVLRRPLAYALFLGVVLSVTAVSVAAKILIEREVLRRRYAQVILAAGIASEVVVWLLVSVVSAAHSDTPALAIRSSIFALGFFIVMLTLGRRFVFWSMRRVADSTRIVKGQLSLVLVLMLLSAALTQALGLHPLLGAFVLGVLLSRSPRANRPLLESIQTLTSSLFAPIFFVLAGMRVDLPHLGGPGAIGTILLLFAVASAVKLGLGSLGARLGGLTRRESALVGVGLNMKGGTDVIVAIVGVELGLLAGRTYTLYAVVAFLTVFLSPLALAQLEKRTPPVADERERLEREEAQRRAYVPGIERVLVPMTPQLLPSLASPVIQRIAAAAERQGQILDISEIVAKGESGALEEREPVVAEAMASMRDAQRMGNVEVLRREVDERHTLRPILDASSSHDLIALGARPQAHRTTISFGRLQDAIIQRAGSDVLLVTSAQGNELDLDGIKRVLVPTNGLEYSMAAGDVAAYLAAGLDAELVLLHTVSYEMDALFWRERDHRRLRTLGENVVGELEFRVRRLGVRATSTITVGNAPGEAILKELAGGGYQLVVLGGYNRGTQGRPYLGGTIRGVVSRSLVPAVVLISRLAPRR
jgi:Kef-type K+ transport system membrane component KefB/nucleotide-binding universal stress UspA family protein